ncbi:MAG: hypothetical protein FWB98_05780 [Defluviitaleaceae bacterium]|nr:hypothetical protein [Defluviitaleaceae bacterium]
MGFKLKLPKRREALGFTELFFIAGGIVLLLSVLTLVLAWTNNFASRQNISRNITFEEGVDGARGNRNVWLTAFDRFFNRNNLLGSPGDFVLSGNWTFNAVEARGQSARSLRLNRREMENFHITSSNDAGQVVLRIWQSNSPPVRLELTGGVEGYIDLTAFGLTPGWSADFILEFFEGEGVDVWLRWR